MSESAGIAVLAGNIEEFEHWVRSNPDRAGKLVTRGRSQRAFAVIEERHVLGAIASGVVTTGTWYRRRNARQLEEMAKLAVLRCEEIDV